MGSARVCSISIDLDSLVSYYQIHGLGDPPRQLRGTILRKALPRFAELLREAAVPATFFIVARDLCENEESQELLKQLIEHQGCEVANHTYSHPYDLCRLPEQVVEQEIRRGHDTIAELLGRAPVGFRAPGYSANAKVFRVLGNYSYLYDSSMFPSPPYYVAKMAIMAGMSVRGRASGAVIGDPRCLLSPAEPYRPDPVEPWRRGQGPVIELPVAVLPWSRLPAIGTMVAVSPEWLRQRLLQGIAARPFFNFELHGIDLADAIEDRIPTELAGRQPDLRVPVAKKRQKFLETLCLLKGRYQFQTLAQVATTIQREGTVAG
jgi:hypothetical protein